MMTKDHKERPSAAELLNDPRIISKCRKFDIHEFKEEKDTEKMNLLLDTIMIPKDFNKLELPKKMQKRTKSCAIFQPLDLEMTNDDLNTMNTKEGFQNYFS